MRLDNNDKECECLQDDHEYDILTGGCIPEKDLPDNIIVDPTINT